MTHTTHTTQAAEALELSILHWQENVAAETPDGASTNASKCALCREFAGDGCRNCPVMARTGRDGCFGTPYYEAYDALRNWRDGINARREQWRIAAQAELDFLISLRDPTEQEQA